MKTKEQIEEKIKSMEIDLDRYKENWEHFEHSYPNGVIKKIDEDVIYTTIINQLEVLKWVLKDN